MAEEAYVLPSYQFEVSWGGGLGGFSEVSGLNIEYDVIDYRHGMEKAWTVHKLTGLRKYSNITMKRGMLKGDNDFFKWMNAAKKDKPERRDMTVSLLDEDGKPIVSWKIKSAWPVKVEGPSLNAKNSEVAVESIEVAHEGLVIENG